MDVPAGIITIWSGAINQIPYGWVFCNGANGTPDLRNRFIIGAGDTYAVDDTGGSINHDHTFTGDGHTHEIGTGGDIAEGSDYYDITNSAPASGTTDNGSSLPPYYALAYIMKT